MGCDEDDGESAGKPRVLTAAEAVAMFRGALNEELGLATAGLFDGEACDDRTSRILEAVYRIAARFDPNATTVSAELLNALSHSFSEADAAR